MKKLLFAAVLLFTSCTDSEKATKALRAAGFSNIEITGYSYFECGEDDSFATGFKATNPNGERVSGTVCSGLLKGATIRY